MATRREALKTAALAVSGAVLASSANAAQAKSNTAKKLKILVAGAHPDDPETGMGGTILKYTQLGHEVVVLYFTRGEAGIEGISHDEAAKIRTAEIIEAEKILGTRSIFFGQIDGSTEIAAAWYNKMQEVFANEKPDILFTHWPIDTHRDHRICGNLVYDAWLYSGLNLPLYYYEVCTGVQSQNFQPTHFVDISAVVEQKWAACFVHKSLKIGEVYPEEHAKMELFRGIESHAKYAEAFVHHWVSPHGFLP